MSLQREPRGGPWNVGDQAEPDGYVVILLDAASAARGYWVSHAYATEDVARAVAGQDKGAVAVPFYFAPAWDRALDQALTEATDRILSAHAVEMIRKRAAELRDAALPPG